MAALDLRGSSCALAAFAAVTLLSAAGGGYSPQSWGWAGLGASCVALAAIAVRREPLGLLASAYVGLFALSGLWALATALWSVSAPSSILDAQRSVVIVGAGLAAVALARRQDGTALRLGVLVAICVVCGANLVYRVQGIDGTTTGAEAAPIGYANGLGIMAAVGCLLTLELARTRTAVLLLLPLPALTLLLSESTGAALALAAGAAVSAIAFGGRARLLGLLLLLIGAAIATASFSGHLRDQYWAVAWEGVREHPLEGTGAGTFAQLWVLERNVPYSAQDAHSLYIESLSEQGPLGLALVTFAIALPLLAGGWRTRPFAVGAYAAVALHAGVDWDWELTAVALTTVLIGTSLLLEGNHGSGTVRVRPLWLGAAAALAICSAVVLVGAVSLDRARSAFAAGHLVEADDRARTAARAAPWSTEVARVRSEILLARGRREGARSVIRAAIERDPRDWRLWILLARASAGAERERALARARSLNPLGGI